MCQHSSDLQRDTVEHAVQQANAGHNHRCWRRGVEGATKAQSPPRKTKETEVQAQESTSEAGICIDEENETSTLAAKLQEESSACSEA